MHRLLNVVCSFVILLIANRIDCQRNEVEITNENVDRFEELLSSAEPRTTFILSTSVDLFSVVSITANRVTLRGQSAVDRPVIACRQNEEAGFEIIANRVEFANLVIRDCSGTAISVFDIVEEIDPFAQQDAPTESGEPRSLAVTFRNIDFLNNTGTEVDTSAGAIYLDRRAEAEVVGCLFEGNSAPTGGAINTKSASLTVRDSVFRNNNAINIGGAIYGSASDTDRRQNMEQENTMEISNCSFLNNRVLRGDRDTVGLTITEGIELEANPYLNFPLPSPSGGALNLADFSSVNISGSTFDGNFAVPAGGALYLGDNERTEIRNSTFVNNHLGRIDSDAADAEDLQLGGALFVVFTIPENRIEMDRCSFENNTAAYGGAIHFVGPISGQFSITFSTFRRNQAFLGGGAVALRNINAPAFRTCTFTRNRALVGGAIFITNGGGLRIQQGITGRENEFRNNVAYDGGAIFGMGAGTVQIVAGEFYRNHAERHGGAVCIIDAKAGGIAGMQEAKFIENKAERGGAAFLENLVTVTLVIGPRQEAAEFVFGREDAPINQFRGNEAVAGGALFYKASNLLSNTFAVDFCEFIDNKAHANLSYVFNEPLDYPRREDISEGLGRRLMVETDLEVEEEVDASLLDPLGLEPCYPGGGGAVCLVLTGVAQRAPVTAEIIRSRFENNSAIVAGGLFLATDESVDWREQCPETDRSTATTLTSDPCRTVSLTELTFNRNFATLAGGGIFASNMSHVWYIRSAEIVESEQYIRLAATANERNFRRNSVGGRGYGPNIAGNAVSLNLSNPVPHPKTGYLISNQSTGQSNPLEEITVEVLDGVGQVVSAGIIDTNLRVRVRAVRPPNDTSIASGQVAAIAEAGIVKFEALSLLAPAGTYTVEFLPSRDAIDPVLGEVEIRACLLGEVNDTAGSVCEFCPFEFFSLDTSNSTCDTCPLDARCSGGYSLVPLPNFWHSSPFSTIMHECFHHDACDYTDRTKRLEESLFLYRFEFLERFRNEEEPEFSTEEYRQCAEGYEGPLCGACADGYGRANGKTCAECRSRLGTALVVFLLALWQLVLLAITIRSALVSIRDMNQMMTLIGQQSNVAAGPSASTARGLPTQPTRGRGIFQMSEIFRMQENLTVAPEQLEEVYGRENTVTAGPSQAVIPMMQKQKISVDYIIAAQHVSETIKIFVNFFQVTSVAVNINVDWTTTVKNMLATMNSIAGFSNGATFTPMTCMLDNSADDRSIHGVILRIAFPTILMLICMLFFFVQYIVMIKTPTYTRNYCSSFMRSRLVISFLVVGFFSYQSISEELMGTVSCIELDKDELNDDTAYPHYSIARDRYWTEDTTIQCFERKHAYLAGFLGIPGIIFFLIGIPGYLLFFLLYKRSEGQLLEMNVLNTYGFIYQNYEDRFVYWEVCILIRKALIGAIIVFAYPLGANLQGVMALGVLILALAFHLIAAPFKYLLLNVLEGCSLLVSIFTFYVGIVFNDENTSHAADVLLSTLLVLINLTLVVAFLVCVFKHADKYVIAKLQYLDVKDIPANFLPRVAKLAAVVIGQASQSIANTLRQTLRRNSQTGMQTPGGRGTRRNVMSPPHDASSNSEGNMNNIVQTEPEISQVDIELTPETGIRTHQE